MFSAEFLSLLSRHSDKIAGKHLYTINNFDKYYIMKNYQFNCNYNDIYLNLLL
jgi:hypothetical protein